MGSVTSKVKLNYMAIREFKEAEIRALEKTAEALHTDVVQSQVMPRDTGCLQNESTFVDISDSKAGDVKLVSSTPYARRVYFHPEYNFKKTENPNAQGRWLDAYINGRKKDFCQKAFNVFLKKEGGL